MYRVDLVSSAYTVNEQTISTINIITHFSFFAENVSWLTKQPVGGGADIPDDARKYTPDLRYIWKEKKA